MAIHLKKKWLVLIGSLVLGAWLNPGARGQQNSPAIKEIPELFKEGGFKYKIFGKGFKVTHQGVVLEVRERGKGDYRYANIYWTMPLSNGFKADVSALEKLNDLNNSDIFANITILRNGETALISGDYTFLLRGADGPVMKFFLDVAA